MTKTGNLTQTDLDAALSDERHYGFGYATRDELPARIRQALDAAVLEVANEIGVTREQLFHWANSKDGRWLCDHASDGNTSLERVRTYLNPDAIKNAIVPELLHD